MASLLSTMRSLGQMYWQAVLSSALQPSHFSGFTKLGICTSLACLLRTLAPAERTPRRCAAQHGRPRLERRQGDTARLRPSETGVRGQLPLVEATVSSLTLLRQLTRHQGSYDSAVRQANSTPPPVCAAAREGSAKPLKRAWKAGKLRRRRGARAPVPSWGAAAGRPAKQRQAAG